MSDSIELLETKVKMLTTALQLCKTLLDALRMDSNIGSHLLPYEKAAFERTDTMVTKALVTCEKGVSCDEGV